MVPFEGKVIIIEMGDIRVSVVRMLISTKGLYVGEILKKFEIVHEESLAVPDG